MSTTVFAQEIGEAGVGIRPALVEELVNPGETYTYTFTISNVSDVDQTYYLSVKDIIDSDAQGRPLYSVIGGEATGYELSSWTMLPQTEVAIPARQDATVELVIAIPVDASPGNRFGGIFASIDPPEFRQTGASVGYEVGNIISLRIPGDVNESGVIRSFSTANYLHSSLDIEFITRIENTGTTLIKPYGPLQVKNMFGKEVANFTFNDQQAGIFPGKTREFTKEWQDDNPGFGRYTATISLIYGIQGKQQTMSNTLSFWVLPLSILLPALGGLVFLLLVVYIAVRLYVRQKLNMLVGVSSRRLTRQSRQAPPLFLITVVAMLVTTALFLLILLVLFA